MSLSDTWGSSGSKGAISGANREADTKSTTTEMAKALLRSRLRDHLRAARQKAFLDVAGTLLLKRELGVWRCTDFKPPVCYETGSAKADPGIHKSVQKIYGQVR